MDLPQPGPMDEPPRSKLRRLIPLLVLLTLGCLVATEFWRSGALRRDVERTRQSLARQGFKLDFAQFDFSTTPELAARAAALSNAALACGVAVPFPPAKAFLPNVGSNAALVIWTQPGMKSITLDRQRSWINADWAQLRPHLEKLRPYLDSACAAAISGPIRYPVAPRPAGDIPLPHLTEARLLCGALASVILLDLHQTNHIPVWTNLIALIRLATAWNPEPVELSQFMRFTLARVVRSVTWQVVQAGVLTDSQLAALQREWESVDYFSALPETAALYRAGLLANCQYERQLPADYSFKRFLEQLFDSPHGALSNAQSALSHAAYRRSGSYQDEKAVMLYFRDRELELREAIRATNWLAMSQLPGAGKPPPFKGVPQSRITIFQNLKRVTLGYRQSLLESAAEAEARRRVVIAALAVERFRLKSGHYPESLQQLVPEFLPRVPIDFIDSLPLRYFRTEDGHFVLYSIGLDGVDNHGAFVKPGSNSSGPLPGDLVWPRPATPADLEKFPISYPADE